MFSTPSTQLKQRKPTINEKINQVTKHVEIPQLQIVEKTANTPETQITQGTQTSESMGNATARQVVEIEAYLPAESASPMFVSKPVSETPVVEYVANACEVRDSSADSLPNCSDCRHWDSVEDTPVAQQSLLPTAQTAQKTEEIPQVRHIDKVVGVPVVDQRQTSTIQTEQKTIDVPQIQCLEPLVDVPVVTQQTAEIPVVMLKQVPVMVRRQIPLVQKIQKMVEVPQIKFIDNVVNAPVSMQREVQVQEQSDDTMAAVTTGVNPNTSGAMAPHRKEERVRHLSFSLLEGGHERESAGR